MLKAVIVYLQGSGGNLLARSLALDANTIPFVGPELAEQQPTLSLSMSERLTLYNNWNETDWTKTEKDLAIWYHHGLADFVDYETSELMLIDTFHPAAFVDENNKQLLWNSWSDWQHHILVDWDDDDLEDIILLARLKRKDLLHANQIKNQELKLFKQIKQQSTFHCINWKDMLQLESYIAAIANLAIKLELNLDLDSVALLWQSWRTATDRLLENYERS